MKKNTTHQAPAASSTVGEPKSLRIKSGVKSGGIINHNETGLRVTKRLRIKSGVQAGGMINHNETALRARPTAK